LILATTLPAGILLLLLSAEPFGAPLPPRSVLLRKSSEPDAYDRRVAVAVYRSPSSFDSLRRFYRRSKSRLIRVEERRESIDPRYVLDPSDPKTYFSMLRVVNLDYSKTWAAVYVRPLGEGSLLVVLERKEAPEVTGENGAPNRIAIPRVLFEVGLTPLSRP
jgi:hypothetical protein